MSLRLFLVIYLIKSSSTSIKLPFGPPSASQSSGGPKQYKSAMFNKPLGFLMNGGCCSCSDCCPCDLGPGGVGGVGSLDYDAAGGEGIDAGGGVVNGGLVNGGGLYNRYGGGAVGSTNRRSLVVRRRYLRPNGAYVWEVEEQTGSGLRGGGLFGGSGLFSRYLPFALENGNITRTKQVELNETLPNNLVTASSNFDSIPDFTSGSGSGVVDQGKVVRERKERNEPKRRIIRVTPG